jgi:hypothetical protein
MAEKKVDNSIFWYIIIPICILLLLIFFVYVLFHVSSIQLVGQEKVMEIVNKLGRYNR